MPRQPVGPDETSGSDGDSGGLVESRVREIVAGMFVGGILSVVGMFAGFGIDIVDTVRSSLTSAGSGIASEAASIGDLFVDVVIVTPLEGAGDLAVSTWIFAPISSALVFALVAAMSAGIIYGTWRLVVIVT